MIKTVRIDITAGNPETPLGDFVAFVGSAISFTLTNVPRELGRRVIERVAIEARTHQGIVRSFEAERVGSAWGVTIADDFFTHPCYVKGGIKVTAFGTGNDGAAEQWTLGIGDITILENTVTIQPLDELQELVVVDGAYLENPKKGYFDLGGMRIYDGTRWVEVGGGGTGATVLTMNGGKLYNGADEITQYTELLALVQAGGVVLKGEVSGKVALFYPLFCDANAVRFDATGTLGSAVQTKSYAMTPKTGGGINIAPSGLTELAKKSDIPTSMPWGSVTDKPSVFPPETHSHEQSEVTGLEVALSGKLDCYIGHEDLKTTISPDIISAGNFKPLLITAINSYGEKVILGYGVEWRSEENDANSPTIRVFRENGAKRFVLEDWRGQEFMEGGCGLVRISDLADKLTDADLKTLCTTCGISLTKPDGTPKTRAELLTDLFGESNSQLAKTIREKVLADGEGEIKAALFTNTAFSESVKETAPDGSLAKEIYNLKQGGGGGDSKPKINSFEQLKAYIDEKVADTSFASDEVKIAKMKSDLVGIEIEDTWANTGGTIYFDPMIIVNVGKWKGEDGEMHIGAMVMHKYATTETVVFDMANQEVASESTAQEGVYYYGLALGETTVTAAKLTLLDLAVGDALPKSEYKTIYKSAIRDTSRNILQYGHNNWRDSAYRQWLNSNVAKGTSWWTKPYTGKVTPSNATTLRGYIQGCSGFNGLNADGTPKAYNNGVLKFAKPVYITTSPNYICDGGNNPDPSVGAYETLDLFFLPSGAEMFGNVNTTGSGESIMSYEGEFSPYWKEATGFIAPNTTYSAARSIFTENGQSSASYVRLRSAYRGSSYNVWHVNTSGTLSSSNAYTACAAAPACVIY